MKAMPDKSPFAKFLRTYQESDIIFEGNSPGSEMYVIHSGKVRLTTKKMGRDVILATLGPEEFFGEMALVDSSYGKYVQEARLWGNESLKICKKLNRDRVEAKRHMGTFHWLTGKKRDALKWWRLSIETGERFKMKPELSRTYFEIGKRLSEPNSPYRELNSISAAEYLNKAKTMFEEMDLQWDLEQLEHVVAGHH